MAHLEIPYDMKLEAVKTNFNKTLREGRFNICEFESCCRTLNVEVPSEVHDFLHPLHCLKFSDMTLKLRKHVVELMVSVYNQEPAVYVAEDGEIKGLSVGFELNEKRDTVALAMRTTTTGEVKSLE